MPYIIQCQNSFIIKHVAAASFIITLIKPLHLILYRLSKHCLSPHVHLGQAESQRTSSLPEQSSVVMPSRFQSRLRQPGIWSVSESSVGRLPIEWQEIPTQASRRRAVWMRRLRFMFSVSGFKQHGLWCVILSMEYYCRNQFTRRNTSIRSKSFKKSADLD
jgi:hypothetical protein